MYGYDLNLEGETTKLTLYWGTDRRLERSYKVFVHAVDRTTGAMLAQYDAAPRNWTYPTTWWEAGEVISDPIELSLGAADPANVDLVFGLYDETTGERLAVTTEPPGTATGADEFTINLRDFTKVR